jgi:hypothetical protein
MLNSGEHWWIVVSISRKMGAGQARRATQPTGFAGYQRTSARVAQATSAPVPDC